MFNDFNDWRMMTSPAEKKRYKASKPSHQKLQDVFIPLGTTKKAMKNHHLFTAKSPSINISCSSMFIHFHSFVTMFIGHHS